MVMVRKRLALGCGDDERHSDQSYLIRLATEMNNVGATLQRAGDTECAVELYRASFVTFLEGSRIPRVKHEALFQLSENYVLETNRLAILRFGKEKMAATPLSSSCATQETQEDQNCRVQKSNAKVNETFFLTEGIKTSFDEEGKGTLGSIGSVIFFNMGVAEYHKGRLESSKTLFLEALSIGEALPEGSLVQSFIHNNLGHIYHFLQRYVDALNAFKHARRIYLMASDLLDIQYHDEPTSSVDSLIGIKYFPFFLHNLGCVHLSDEAPNYEFAAEFFRDALCETDDPELTFSIAAKLHQIGRSYHREGKYEKAILLYRDILALSNIAISTKCSPIMKLFSHLLRDQAYIHFKIGQYQKAMVDLTLSLRMMVAAVGKDDPMVVWLKKHNDQFLNKIRQKMDGDKAAPAA